MAYIAFDMDAMRLVPQVAQAASMEPPVVGWGLVQLWQFCWLQKTETVTATHLKGFFGGDISDALLAFGFLERSNKGFRVRGADRYLRIQKAQADAGKRASDNLKQNSKTEPPAITRPDRPLLGGADAGFRVEPEPSRNLAGTQPGPSRSQKPALTPNTEHRTPNEKTTAGASRSRALSDALCVVFREITTHKYEHQGPKDAEGLKRLLKFETTDEEILRRWRRGLVGTYKRDAKTIAQLASKWNELATDEARAPAKGAGYTNGGTEWVDGVDQVAALFGEGVAK